MECQVERILVEIRRNIRTQLPNLRLDLELLRFSKPPAEIAKEHYFAPLPSPPNQMAATDVDSATCDVRFALRTLGDSEMKHQTVR